MGKQIVAEVSLSIQAPPSKVWEALVSPEIIKRYMFGSTVTSEWKEGSPILWKGEWKGRAYEDRGVILRIEPERLLQYSHFSPLSGLTDAPENYHRVTITLRDEKTRTFVSLQQDNNETEEARAHSEANWQLMLEGLKKVVEQ